MTNPANFGSATVRLAADPTVFTNTDGSRSVTLSGYADHNYTSRDGKVGSDNIQFNAFVAKDRQPGALTRIHKGDLVQITYSLRTESFERAGKTVYELRAIVDNISFLEPKSVTDERLIKRLKAGQKVVGFDLDDKGALVTA